MTLKGILFDFDGTIGDTTNLILSSFHTTMEHFGYAPVSDKEIITTFGLPLEDGLAVLMPNLHEKEVIDFYRDHNFSHHDALIKPFPYVEEGVKALFEANYKLAVVTSKKQRLAHRGLDILHLAPYFKAVITSEDCKDHKPLPEPMERGAAALNLSPTECLCIGDSPYDMLSGKAAGCTTVLVNWTPYEDEQIASLVVPDYRIDKMTDLVPLLEELNKEKS